ncbi:hypothetical protein NHQ30_003725 [Ciborinia camelliae]|nr:hypothetical protein NHQ30_003725 [Ciborinia camelliae]
MFPNAGNKVDWEEKEIESFNQPVEKEETEVRDEWCLSERSNPIERPGAPRNFLNSPSLSRPAFAHSPKVSDSQKPTVGPYSSRSSDALKQWGEDLGGRRRFDFDALQNALKQALNNTGGSSDDKGADDGEEIEGVCEGDQESELKAAFLDDDEEEEEGEEYHDAVDKLSDHDVIFYDKIFQERTGDLDTLAEDAPEENEPFFEEHLFNDPLQALEDQENGFDGRLPRSFKPDRPEENSFSLSKTWLTRFKAMKPKRTHRMPNRPGRFVNLSSKQVLVLIVIGIDTNAARPTRGESKLRRHPKFGQFVSLSSPLRHCWTYISSE